MNDGFSKLKEHSLSKIDKSKKNSIDKNIKSLINIINKSDDYYTTSSCSGRIVLLRWTIMFAAFGFLFNMLTVLGLYLDEIFIARVIFGSCCLSMIISIVFFIREIHTSTKALKLHMSDMDVDVE